MRLWLIPMLGAVVAAATLSLVAAPLQAQSPAYGGIGARLSHFNALNPPNSGTPPVGVAYYRIADLRSGRVASYHVALSPQSQLTATKLRRLLTGRELPADAKQIKRWKPDLDGGHCAVYKSRWLRRRLYGPYVVLYVSAVRQSAGAMVSTAPDCRG